MQKKFLPDIPPHQYPGQAVVCELYLLGGIRTAELGTFAFGVAGENGENDTPATHELVRLAAPRKNLYPKSF
ncbi:MAG: hypothetical protein CM1200mP7_3660 [Chloroflexota bacterium]|nr:MAG: hypothetical protein CM1200mP7_3660 [Chloroflexota bacterium]